MGLTLSDCDEPVKRLRRHHCTGRDNHAFFGREHRLCPKKGRRPLFPINILALDSFTHIAVGSALGMAAMGACSPRWKAALWGSVCQTLPDLDTFIHHGDPIRDMTLHRGDSHSLFYLTLLAPFLAWGISRIYREPQLFWRWLLLTWLALVLHPLLDVTTVYGTQLLRPFTDYPFGAGAIFIIDPLFTVPVTIGALVALCWRSPSALRWNAVAMGLSAAYLAWTFVAQHHVTGIAREALREQKIDAQLVEVDPTALNTVLWRVTVITADSYLEGFYSLLDESHAIVFQKHPRGEALYEQTRTNWNVARMAWFTHGFFKMEHKDGLVTISDLRLGMEPYYGFTFAVFEDRGGVLTPIVPKRTGAPLRPDAQTGLPWLWHRLKGEHLAPLT